MYLGFGVLITNIGVWVGGGGVVQNIKTDILGGRGGGGYADAIKVIS